MINFGVICVSDRCSRGECQDKSGPLISELVSDIGDTVFYQIVPDETEEIQNTIKYMCDEIGVDVVLTTGGTGFAPRDVTPEATKPLFDKEAPGIAEGIRAKSLQITPKAMLTRGVSGIRKKTLIINLPGSPKAVRETTEILLPVIPHAVETLKGDVTSCGGNY